MWIQRKTALHGDSQRGPASENPRLIARLVRSLYGTRDAPQLWTKHVGGTLRELGYQESKGAPGSSGIRVLELNWSCTSMTSWSLARNRRWKI